jgi:peptide/nickel transport system permease protein
MARYTIRRILSFFPVLLGVTIIVFMFIHLIPGDPAAAMLRENAPPEVAASIRADLGLDKPLYEQYYIYMDRTLHLNLGESLVTHIPVASELANRFPATAELAVSAMLIAIFFGIPLGILSAMRRNSWLDTLCMFFALVGVSMPIFWLGQMLSMLFGVTLHWLPFQSRIGIYTSIAHVTGFYLIDSILSGNLGNFIDVVRHLILPATVLATVPTSILARMTRAAMLEALNQDYIRTAQAKGLRERVVILRHALKNAMLPIVTVIGLQTGFLLSGAILTESIFSWPGIGRWVYDEIGLRDYPVIQGAILFIAVIFVIVNLFVDLSYAYLDPRIQYE